MGYSVQPRDQIFGNGFRFLSFAKYMDKNIGKNISKYMSGKYSHKCLDHTKLSTVDTLKTVSKRTIQKTAEGTGDLFGNKIADKITKVSRISPQNSLETGKNEHDKETPKERYISSEERHKNIDNLRLIYNITLKQWNIKK